MPIIAGYTHTLVPADNGTRVRIDSPVNTLPITVEVGDTNQVWPNGTYIEVVRLPNCLASVVIVGAFGVTVNDLSGAITLEPGEHCRVSKVSGVADTWDLHTYRLPTAAPAAAAFVFQVGTPASGHFHPVEMSLQQARALVQGTTSFLPVADPSQPSVVLTSNPNSDPGNPQHTHDLTVFFDYVNHTFVVTDISNNGADNHAAMLIGDGSGGASGGATALEFLTDVDFGDYPPNDRDILVYNAGTQVWEPSAQQGLPYDLKGRPMETFIIPTAGAFGNSRHHNSTWRSTSATPVNVPVPLDSSWGFEVWWENGGFPTNPGPMPAGGSAVFGKHGAGNVTFVPEPGVIINTPDTLTISRLHGKATLIKVGPNEWDLEGNVGT